MAIDETNGPRNFATTFAELGQGDFNLKLGVEQQKLLAELQDAALAGGNTGKSKGTITITLKYEVGANGTLTIVPTFTVKCPKPGVPATVAWVDKSANISWQDPRQMKLSLREVPGGQTAKDAKDPSSGKVN